MMKAMNSKHANINVSIIESDLLMRQMMASMMRKTEGITLAGATSFTNQMKAISDILSQMPDLLMLGVPGEGSEEMSLFRRIRNVLPQLPVVLLTARNQEGARVAVTGLRQGAADFITKPDKRNGLILATQHFRKRVYPIVRAVPKLNLVRIGKISEENVTLKPETHLHQTPSGSDRARPINFGLISVHGCLGALPGLFKLLSKLPSQMPVPVMVIQHMPKYFTEELARQLDEVTSLHVREAKNNSPLLAGQVYIAPGGFHSVVRQNNQRSVISIHRGVKEQHCRPSSDMFLRSAVQAYNGKVLSVFLSGGGTDGIDGARDVLQSGGKLILEDDESTILSDVTHHIKKLSKAISYYSADQIPAEIMRVLVKENDVIPYHNRLGRSRNRELL